MFHEPPGMDPQLVFSELAAERLGEMKALDRACFSAADQWSDDFYRAIFGPGSFRTVGALHRGQLVGYALLDFSKTPVRLRSIGVRPEDRRRGFGSRLLQAAMTAAGGPLELLVDEDNREAIHLYCRHGFEFVDNTTEVPSRKAMRSGVR